MALGQTLLRKSPRSHPLTRDENQPLKPKSRRSEAQVALTVSSVEATASAEEASPMATTTSAPTTAATCPPTPHRQVLTPVLATGTRTGPSQNTSAALAAYDVLPPPPGAAGGAGRTWTWPARARRDRRPCGGRAATLHPSGRRRHRKQHQSRPGRGARHAAAASTTDGERPSPPITEGRSGPLPTRRWAPTRCTLLPSTDDEHP
jgi:hypothetical protein